MRALETWMFAILKYPQEVGYLFPDFNQRYFNSEVWVEKRDKRKQIIDDLVEIVSHSVNAAPLNFQFSMLLHLFHYYDKVHCISTKLNV